MAPLFVLLSASGVRVVYMAMSGMTGEASWSQQAALSLLMSLPVVVIFLGLQRYLPDRVFLSRDAEV